MSEAWTVARYLPSVRWIRGYDRPTFGADARAGATVAVLLIPQGMAYAALAGMPPITGLYAAIVALLVYAVLGTSNYSSVAPVAIDSLLVAAAVGPLAGGDPTRYVALAGLLAVLTGVLQIGAGVLRVGALVSFISIPVISGFTTAAALTIAASQLKDFLGVGGGGGSTTLVDTLSDLISRLDGIRPATPAVGVGAVAALLVLRRFAPRVPAPLLVVGAAALVVVLVPGLAGRVAVLGEVPAGLPAFALPSLSPADVSALLPAAAAIALVSYLESISTATVFARRTRGRVDANGELIGIGAANLAVGFFRGFTVAAGFSRGAVNVGAGARTPMSGVLAALLVAVALLTVTPLLAMLPKVALAAVIIVAVASLVDVRGARSIARARRSDLVALLATFVATLVLGPATGLGVGVGVSIVAFLRHSARPHLPELGRVHGTTRYRNVARHDAIGTDPTVALFRLDAPLYFANARAVADRIADAVAQRPDLRAVILDASSLPWVDYTGTVVLAELDEVWRAAGVALHLAAVRGPVSDVLARSADSAHLLTGNRVHATSPPRCALSISPPTHRCGRSVRRPRAPEPDPLDRQIQTRLPERAEQLDLRAAVHDDLQPRGLGQPSRLVVAHAELRPQHLRTDLDRLVGDPEQCFGRTEHLHHVHRTVDRRQRLVDPQPADLAPCLVGIHRNHFVAGLVEHPQNAVAEFGAIRTGTDHGDGLHLPEDGGEVLRRIILIMIQVSDAGHGASSCVSRGRVSSRAVPVGLRRDCGTACHGSRHRHRTCSRSAVGRRRAAHSLRPAAARSARRPRAGRSHPTAVSRHR